LPLSPPIDLVPELQTAMNCREAENLIFAARDGALDQNQRAALASHLTQCPACQAMQAELESAAVSWRAADAATRVPVVEREWHAIRRRIRADEPAAASSSGRWLRPALWGFAAAAAALAFALFVSPRWLPQDSTATSGDAAYVSYVKVFNTSAETMVYEDAESGWLVVWVSDDGASTGT
jgi:anti-sigma factor RsiW